LTGGSGSRAGGPGIRAVPHGHPMLADCKSTFKAGEVSIETGWGGAYKRQMQFYQFVRGT